MQIEVDDSNRRVTFLYKLEDGVAEGSFGMHCAAMCGIPEKVVARAEEAAEEWECTGRLKGHVRKGDGMDVDGAGVGKGYVPLGWLSDVAWLLRDGDGSEGVDGNKRQTEEDLERGMDVLMRAIERM